MTYFEEEKVSEDGYGNRNLDSKWSTVKLQRQKISSLKMMSLPCMTEQELDCAVNAYFNEDQSTQKTFTRILVENFLSKYSWYFPSQKKKNPPSLSKAYSYFEHVTLPRRLAGDQTAKHILRRSDPGETELPTELYSVCGTSSRSFVEWGIGIDQYFITLRIMAIILFVSGLIHLPLLMYYRSDDYSPSDKAWLFLSLQGSAVCTTTEWVACSDCDANFESRKEELQGMIGTAIHPLSQDNITLVERYNCDGGHFPQGIINYSCLYFLVAAMLLMHMYLSAREIRFDEDKISSSDYTVVVQNPPKNAFNPDEWRDFFCQFASKQVTAVTIALDNDELLRKLIKRRQYRYQLKLMLPKEIDMEDEDHLQVAVAELVRERDQEAKGCAMTVIEFTIFPILQLVDMYLPAETLLDRMMCLNDEIKELLKRNYDVTKVFVTFETEEGQRAALTGLSTGRFDVMMNNTRKIPPSTIFRNQVLSVTKTAEANAIRWLDLGSSNSDMLIWRAINLGITCVILGICGFIVASVRLYLEASWAATVVIVFNFLIPQIVYIMMLYEPHHTEGSFQASLYTKITLFRWFNTALLAKMITSWTVTLGYQSKNILPSINSVMWNELLLTPALQILDLWGSFQKHYLAPRARTQAEMNMNFQGTVCNLGERYTALTNVLFLCFFYSALFPASFFFGTAIVICQYFTDKFCLMRVWANSAELGSEVARFSRKYFFSGALLSYCVVSAYAWAGFPYDNLCLPSDSNTAQLVVNVTYSKVLLADKKTTVPEISVENPVFYTFCQQNWLGFDGLPFPPTARIQSDISNWMGSSQERLTNLYGWTAVIALCICFAFQFGSEMINFLLSWFRGVYNVAGQEQNVDFSSDDEISGYVPQIKVVGFFFPFLACDVDQIKKSLIGWSDRGHPYDYHNMIFDVPWDGMPRREQNGFHGMQKSSAVARRQVFSIIKHYPPDWMKTLETPQHQE